MLTEDGDLSQDWFLLFKTAYFAQSTLMYEDLHCHIQFGGDNVIQNIIFIIY